MRVISGKYGGRKLSGFDEEHIRPITDRVKESLFNIIQTHLPDATVLDLFCGTGSLGIEALSRGAASVDFVDQSPRSLKVLQKNLALLKVDEPTKIHRKDVLAFLKSKVWPVQFNIVFIDPPFPLKACQSVLDLVNSCEGVANQALIVIEHSRHEPVENVGALRSFDTRSYGDKSVTFFIKGLEE